MKTKQKSKTHNAHKYVKGRQIVLNICSRLEMVSILLFRYILTELQQKLENDETFIAINVPVFPRYLGNYTRKIVK